VLCFEAFEAVPAAHVQDGFPVDVIVKINAGLALKAVRQIA
jgi:hypothetical protein